MVDKTHFTAGVLLYVGFLIVLGQQTVLPVLPEPELVGYVEPVEMPSFSPTSWWAGCFQRKMEGGPGETGWVDRRAGLRSVWIKTDNQINFNLFGRASKDTARRSTGTMMHGRFLPEGTIVGKDHWLFEEAYVDAFFANDAVESERLERFVADLRLLQNQLTQRDIVFLVVISPSKYSLYPEYLPDGLLEQRAYLWRRDAGRKTNYDAIRPLLDDAEIHWIDGVSFFHEEKRWQRDIGREYRLFPRGGTHWSEYGIGIFSEIMLERLRKLTGKNLSQLACESVVVDYQTTGTDNDLGDLMNLWIPSATKGPTAHPRMQFRPGAWRPSTLWVGSSFTISLTDLMDRLEVYRQRETLLVFSRRLTYPDRTESILKNVPVDWHAELLSRDIVILEMNESLIYTLGYGFVEAALEFLDSQPPP